MSIAQAGVTQTAETAKLAPVPKALARGREAMRPRTSPIPPIRNPIMDNSGNVSELETMWRDYTCAPLSFNGGIITVKRDGSGSFSVREDEAVWDHCDEGGASWVSAKFSAGEAQEIRDHLNKYFPPTELTHLKAEIERYRGDGARFDFLASESYDLRCFDVPTGGGDADIGWRVVGHWMAKPRDRVIAEIFHDDPRAAIDQARNLTPEQRADIDGTTLGGQHHG